MTASRRIRVLHLVDKLTVGTSHMHGVTRLLSWWIPAYDTAEFDVTAASLRSRDRAGETMESLGIRMHYLERGKFDLRTLFDVLRLVRRERIDILHVHGYGSSNFGRLAARIAGIRCIVHEHMYDARVPFYQRVADLALARATDHAIAVSRSVKEFMVRDRAIPEDRLEILYNGVPLAALDRGPTPPLGARDCRWRREHGIPAAHAVVATVGRLHPIKGHHDFLEAAGRVARAYADVTFVIVGDGELMEALQRRAAELGIAPRVRFLGHREDVTTVLAGVDIKAIASHSEGIPLTLFEALAAGCGVVATEVGGLGEVLRDGDNGFLVPAKDPQALASRLLRLLEEPELLAAMGARARETASRYDLESSVRLQEALYRRLARVAEREPHDD